MAASVVSRVGGLGALTAAGQLIIIGTLPLYSRIFDPAIYGEYVVFVGAFTVVQRARRIALRLGHLCCRGATPSR
jgi:hypothetical protein